MTKLNNRTTKLANTLPKGSYAIALIEKSYCTVHTGRGFYSRLFLLQVTSASRSGEVKAFKTSPKATPRKNDRFTTVFAIPPQYVDAAKAIYADTQSDFVGYTDKEHLRLCLVNEAIKAA